MATLEGHSLCVTSVAMSSDGLTAISGSEDKTLRCGVWLTSPCARKGMAVAWCLRVCVIRVWGEKSSGEVDVAE